MEPIGLGIAVVGLANQLLTGYNLLSTARSFGRDYGHLDIRLTTEKLCLEKWAKAWAHDHDGRSDDEQRFAINILAQILTVLAELLEYSSKYGVQGIDRGTRKRDGARALYQSFADSLRRTWKTPQPIQPRLSQDVVELLSQSSLSSLYQIRPELRNEVERLKISTESLHSALPTMKKLRWVFVDKGNFERLIGQLKEYNESLNRVLPAIGAMPTAPTPRGIQAVSFTLVPQLPFARNRMFSGREDIISTIYSTLKGGTSSNGEARLPTDKVVVLHGLGGMGKSSIALEYSFRYSDSYTAVLWVDVTSTATLSRSARAVAEHIIDSYAKQRHSYEDIALMLGLGGVLNTNGQISSDNAAEARLIGAVKSWLATKGNEGWLLILDNYDDVDAVDIHLLLPTSDAGNVIITSRKSNLRSMGKTVAIEEIDEKASMEVLTKIVGREVLEGEEHRAAKQMAVKLGFLPLALTQAGSYISHTQTSFENYLNLLDGEFGKIAKCGGPGWLSDQRTGKLNRNVFTTWEVSFAMLSRPAQELLLLCGSLANADIPDKLFLQARKLQFDWVEEVDWLMAALAELFSFSLAKRKASLDAFWIHPVVHFWARERLDTQSKQRKAQEALILVGGIFKKMKNKSMKDWAFEKLIWSHIDTVRMSTTCELSRLSKQPEGVFHAALNIGRLYVDHGFYSQAGNLFQWSYAGQQKLRSDDHQDTFNAAHYLGIALYRQGEFPKALEWYQKALDGREKTLGKDHPDTLSTVNNMAKMFNEQGEYSKALEWYQRALDGREKTLGKDHPYTLNTVNNMANVFDSQGEYSKALEWHQRALEGREKTLGKDHPSALDTVNDMANVFISQGEYSKALEWYQRALEGREKTLGKDHPSTLDTVNNMAIVFNSQDERPKALEWYQRALDGYDKTLGKDHPHTLNTVNNMANVFNSQGEYSKALEWHRRALEGREKTLGKDHPSTLDTVNNMANVFNSQGEYSKALEWHQRAVEGREKTLGKDHPNTLTTINNIADVFNSQGEYAKALEWYQRALDGREKTLGKDHLDTLNTVHRMADVFDNQGEYSKALEWYQRALDGREKALGKNHPDTLNTIQNMGNVFEIQGEYSKALEWHQRALDGREKTLGKDHPDTLSTVHNMAMVFNSQGECSKALEWYQRACTGFEKTLGRDHPNTLTTVNNIADVFNIQGEYSKALEWYQRALEGREKTLGKDHPSTLTTVNNMAIVFNSQDEHPKALEWYQRALDGYEKTLGKDHPHTLNTVNNMANVFNSQGDYSKALEWHQRALDGREKTLGKDHHSTRASAMMVETLSPFRST